MDKNNPKIIENLPFNQDETYYVSAPSDIVCPVCGDYIVISGRCKTCYNCGWSTCDL